MRSQRWRAVAATRFQWAAICTYVTASVPPLGLLVDPSSPAHDLAQDRLPGGFIATFVTMGIGVLLQRVVTWGCSRVCGFPPVARVSSRAVLWVKVSTQCLHWAAMVVMILTISHWLETYLGLVLFLGLMATWFAAFNAVWLALGYEETVPRGLRTLFAPDVFWMLSRLHGRIYPGERSCVDALMDKALPEGDRLLALELIALRPWVKGGRQAVETIAASQSATNDLVSRARELVSCDFARPQEPLAA